MDLYPPHHWANCPIAVDLSVNGSPRQFRIVAGGYLMSWGKCDDSFYPIKPTTHIWEQNDCASWSPFLPHWLVYSRPILNATLKSTHFYWIHSFWRVQFFSITGHLGLSKIRVAPGRAASLFVEPERNCNVGTLEPWNLMLGCKAGLIFIVLGKFTTYLWLYLTPVPSPWHVPCIFPMKITYTFHWPIPHVHLLWAMHLPVAGPWDPRKPTEWPSSAKTHLSTHFVWLIFAHAGFF